MQRSHGRMVAQIPRILSEGGKHDELRTMLERSIREHSATSEMLAWLCSEREQWSELVTQELLGAIFAALEREQHSTAGGPASCTGPWSKIGNCLGTSSGKATSLPRAIGCGGYN